MISLKNVRKEKNKIYADYYPEWSEKFNMIYYDISNEIFSGSMVGFEFETKNHLAHAKFALMDMAKGEREIKDCKIMWY